MKTYHYLYRKVFVLLLAVMVVPLNSCEDYLDKAPQADISEKDAFGNFRSFQGFMEELYNCIMDPNKGGAWNQYLFADETLNNKPYAFDDGNYWSAEGYFYGQAVNTTDNNSRTKRVWEYAWYAIRKANLAIEKIPGINFPDETQKQRLLAEARFLRAWSYFNVVRLWGDAPLILTPQTAASEDFFPSRTPQEEIYEFVVNELKAAEAAGLPDFRTDGRVSNVAVKSLLAKVYLTMAGYPLQKGASHYSLAAEKALEVINFSKANPSTLNLFPTYADLRNEDLKNRVEHIFQIQYNTVVAGFPLNDMLPNQTAVTYAGPSGTGSTVPTVSFYNSYEAGDLRTKNQVGYFYDTYYVNGTGAPFDLGQPHIFKYFNQKALGGPGINPTRLNNLNVNLIRFAEVLLIYAEAQNEAGGLNQEAYDALKRIRDRAQLTTPPIGSFTQNSFREAVWKERWMEFCYEQITWFDMIRLRKVWNETNRNFDDFVGHRNLNISGGALLEEKHLLFPIPLAEMQNNPNLRPQNPGYVAAPN